MSALVAQWMCWLQKLSPVTLGGYKKQHLRRDSEGNHPGSLKKLMTLRDEGLDVLCWYKNAEWRSRVTPKLPICLFWFLLLFKEWLLELASQWNLSGEATWILRFPSSWLKPRMIKQESHWTWKKFPSRPHQPALHYCSGRPSNFPQNIWNLRWVTHSQALFQAALYRLRGVFLGFVEFWLTKEAELLNSAETFLAEQSGDARGLLQSCLRI